MSSESIRSISSASSFTLIDDNESIITDRSLSPTSTIRTEIDEFSQMKLTISLLKIENEHMRTQKTITDSDAFKNEICGEWKVCSTINCDEYLRKLEGPDMEDVLFLTANKNIDFNGTSLTTFDSVGTKQFNIQKMELSKPMFSKEWAYVTFISDSALKIIYLQEDSDKIEESRYVKNNQLFIVINRFGIEFTRIYQRFGDISYQKSENELEMELRTLRNDYDQLKTVIKKEFEEQMKSLKEENANLLTVSMENKKELEMERQKTIELEEQLNKLRKENARLCTESKQFQEDLKRKEEELREKEQNHEKIREHVAELDREIKNLKVKNAILRKLAKDGSERMEKMETESKEMTEAHMIEIAQLEEKVKELEQTTDDTDETDSDFDTDSDFESDSEPEEFDEKKEQRFIKFIQVLNKRKENGGLGALFNGQWYNDLTERTLWIDIKGDNIELKVKSWFWKYTFGEGKPVGVYYHTVTTDGLKIWRKMKGDDYCDFEEYEIVNGTLTLRRYKDSNMFSDLDYRFIS